MSDARFVVLEGPARDDLDTVTHARPSARPVVVTDPASAVAAVLAAVEGVDLVVVADAGREVVDRLCDDLRRLGTVDHRVVAAPVTTLTPEQDALLAALLQGLSLGEAAAQLHWSRRTADRRLAAARRALGATTTAEAMVRAAALRA